MVNYKEQQLNQIFSALSDPTRREMLKRLQSEDMSVADLSSPFPISKSAITKHVKVLENAGLLKRTVDGRVHNCHLEPEPLKQVSDWMKYYEQFWSNKLDALDAFLAKDEAST
jgi:DNA-binding transcriptional ArsR family regulator